MSKTRSQKLVLFMLSFLLVFSLFTFGKAEQVQAASIKTPTLVSAKRVNKTIKVTWKKVSGVTGYYVYRKAGSNGSWKKIATVKGASKTSYIDSKSLVNGRTYYYTVRAYKGKKLSSYNKTGKKVFYYIKKTTTSNKTNSNSSSSSSSTNSGSTTSTTKATIANTSSAYTIEADVSLSGSGTGYHSKLVVCTATSAISFGIQYDAYARAPYTGKTMFMIENIASNNSGGQSYTWVKEGARNKTYHLMLAVEKNGTCKCYINGTLVKTVKNSNLANQTLYLRVEGAARKLGDKVTAAFSNIKVKEGTYSASKTWGTHFWQQNKGINADVSAYSSSKKITISGTIKGVSKSVDWDSAYNSMSGSIQFVG